jgi:hypothetical protein
MKLYEFQPQAQHNLLNNAYFSPGYRLLYIATPKVACTSFKWWFAELLGVRDAIEQSTFSMQSDLELVIHDTLSRVAPEFTGSNETGLLEALSSPDYFRFCVVRNPYTRVFSAWQSKWLLREPLQAKAYVNTEDEPAIESAADIRMAFEAFLRVLATVDESSLHDVHVAPQVTLLDPERISYKMMAHIEDPSALEKALAAQIGPGFRNPLSGNRANVSLLPYSAAWFSDEAAKLTRSIYARDFEVFGYDTVVPTGAEALSDDVLAMALRSIKLLRGRNVRIGELVARLSMAALVHRQSGAVQSTMQLYWCDLQDGAASSYAEKRSTFDVYQVDGGRKTISLALPAIQQPVTRLRLDPANQPLAIMFHTLRLESTDGALLWRWGGELNAFRHVLGLALRDQSGGMMAVSLSNDPQFELAIPDEALAQVGPGSRMTVEMTVMPLHEGCAEVIRADAQLIADLQAAATSTSIFSATAAMGEAKFCATAFSKDLENIAALLKSNLARRDQTIVEQSMRLAAMSEELLRAEAQLDLLKDVMLGGQGDDHL